MRFINLSVLLRYVLTIPVKLLKYTFWFSSLGICISYKFQLMLIWLVEAHTLKTKICDMASKTCQVMRET